MNTALFNREATNIWKKVQNDLVIGQLQLELGLNKKLLNFFQAGNHFYFVFNFINISFEFVSDDVLPVLGYDPPEFNIGLLLENIHPDDRPWFLNFESKGREFFTTLPVEKLTRYKARYDFRVRKKDREYLRLLIQIMVLEHDDEGQIFRNLGVFTDITHLKHEGKPMLSFIGFDGEPSYIDVDVKEVFTVSTEYLTKREKQILQLIVEGKLSKEIGEILHISKQTVDTHRNNMLVKNKLRNTSELIAKAIRQGWI